MSKAQRNLKKNKASEPFKIGDRVVEFAHPERKSRIVTWVSKNASNRGGQLISTDGHSHYSDAWIFVEAPLRAGDEIAVFTDSAEGWAHHDSLLNGGK